jgi:metal-responsive CopG/Arc/MetJ family transcriptional regulator
MTNAQILSVRVPADLLERIDARCGGQRSRFVREAIAERLGRDAETFVPRTALGRKLAALRQRGLDSGARLLNLEEVNREVARRRGRPE